MRIFLCLMLALAGCARVPPILPQPRYEIGQPYQLGGFWSYPREEFSRTETGLATVLSPAPARRTANGEVFESTAMVAAHRTLQLPAIITLTNMENGRRLTLRVNDRGPAAPGRMVAVSRRAGELLGVAPGASFQARLELQPEPSRALAEGLTPGPTTNRPVLAMTAAPVGRVERETLDAPAGARQAAPRAQATRAAVLPVEASTAPNLPPLRLPETQQQGAPAPGRLYLEAGTFFTPSLAQAQAARIGGRAEPIGPRSRQQEFRVRAGPFNTVAEADAALARARAAGLPELRIVVEQ